MNLEEISKAIEDNKDLAKQVLLKVVETEDGKELLNNHAKQHFEANIGSKVSEIYTNIDNDIFEVLGVRKDPNQKTYDFLKTGVLAELKELKLKGNTDPDKAQKIKSLEDEIKSLKEKTTNSEFWHETHQKALKEFEQKELQYKTQLQELENGNLKNVVNTDLSMGLTGLKFNPTIPKSAIDALAETVKNQALANSKIIDGKVVYLKEDGTPWLDKTYKPITSQGIFAEKLSDILDVAPTVGGGAPTGKGGEIITVNTGGVETTKVVLDKGKFNTRLEFFNVLEKTLTEQGVSKDSSEFAKLRDTAYVEYEVEKLDRV